MRTVSRRIDRLELDAMAGRPQQIAIIRRIVSPGERDDWSKLWFEAQHFMESSNAMPMKRSLSSKHE